MTENTFNVWGQLYWDFLEVKQIIISVRSLTNTKYL